MNERFSSTAKKVPEELPEPGSANDSEFNLDDQVTDHMVSNIPKDVFPLYDVNKLETIVADDVFAQTPLKTPLSPADFKPKAILGAQLEAQAASPEAFLDMVEVIADEEFAKHRILTRDDFSEVAIIKARLAAQGIREDTAPSQHYIDTHKAGRINTNEEVPRAQIKPIEQYETELVAKAVPKYNTTVIESIRNTTPEEAKRKGTLFNENAELLTRAHFPKDAPQPDPIPQGMIKEEKTSLLKRLVPSFLKRFFK